MSQQLQAEYDGYKTALEQLSQKISELESESDEHRIVLESLKPLDGGRRCMRMVGSVLIDQTVKDVIPTLELTREGLTKALDTLKRDAAKTQKELNAWKEKNHVKVVQDS